MTLTAQYCVKCQHNYFFRVRLMLIQSKYFHNSHLISFQHNIISWNTCAKGEILNFLIYQANASSPIQTYKPKILVDLCDVNIVKIVKIPGRKNRLSHRTPTQFKHTVMRLRSTGTS